MSIHTLNQAGLPGVTMRYEEGGKVQVFKFNGKEIKFGPIASDEEIVAAFKDADKEAE